MHQTTLRFAPDAWRAIEGEAAVAGVSTAQFVRDAVLWRMAYEAGRAERDQPAIGVPARAGGLAEPAKEAAREEVSAATALWAQGRQARARAEALRAEAQEKRRNACKDRPWPGLSHGADVWAAVLHGVVAMGVHRHVVQRGGPTTCGHG